MTTNKQDRKEMPMFRGFFQYFPDAVAYVAHVSWKGNEQHNPGQPLHWAREKSTDHGDCILRHQLEAGTFDDDGLLHDGKVAWRAMAQLQLRLEENKRQQEAALAACACGNPLPSAPDERVVHCSVENKFVEPRHL